MLTNHLVINYLALNLFNINEVELLKFFLYFLNFNLIFYTVNIYLNTKLVNVKK